MRRLALVAVLLVASWAVAQDGPEGWWLTGSTTGIIYRSDGVSSQGNTYAGFESAGTSQSNCNAGVCQSGWVDAVWGVYPHSGYGHCRATERVTFEGFAQPITDHVVALGPGYEGPAKALWYACFDLAPPEEETPEPGWHCDNYNDGSQFCWQYEDDVIYVSWQTPCGAFYGETMDPNEAQQWAAAFDASRDEDCTNPLPADPEGVECIGADGLACESTLQEVLYELRMMRHAEATPPVQPPVHEIELDLGEVTVPSFDRDNPTWEGWVEPDFTELEQDTLTARVQAGVLELRSLAETKFPFGMVTWVPTGVVSGAGTCDDPQIALMGTDARGIGWCDSAMELFLAGFGRAALAVLMTIGFGFGVVRTVSLS